MQYHTNTFFLIHIAALENTDTRTHMDTHTETHTDTHTQTHTHIYIFKTQYTREISERAHAHTEVTIWIEATSSPSGPLPV